MADASDLASRAGVGGDRDRVRSAAVILLAVYGRGHRLKMPVMEGVWTVTAL